MSEVCDIDWLTSLRTLLLWLMHWHENARVSNTIYCKKSAEMRTLFVVQFKFQTLRFQCQTQTKLRGSSLTWQVHILLSGSTVIACHAGVPAWVWHSHRIEDQTSSARGRLIGFRQDVAAATSVGAPEDSGGGVSFAHTLNVDALTNDGSDSVTRSDGDSRGSCRWRWEAILWWEWTL